MIPKTIIQTHESEYTFDNIAAECRARLVEFNPGFELRFFAAAARREFLSAHRPELLTLYDFYSRNEQKKDLFKVVALSELGGFFLDLKVRLDKSLEALCSERLVFPIQKKLEAGEFEELHGRTALGPEEYFHLGSYGFGGEAGHPFFEQVIEEMIRRAEILSGLGTSDFDVMLTTGSGVINSVWHQVKNKMGDGMTLIGSVGDSEGLFGEQASLDQLGSYGRLLSG